MVKGFRGHSSFLSAVRARTVFYAAFLLSAAFWARFVLDELKIFMPAKDLQNGVALLLGLPIVILGSRSLSPLRPKLILGGAALAVASVMLCRELPIVEERVHIFEYAILAALAFSDFKRESVRRAFLSAFVLAASVGISDELIQWCLPYRIGDIRDIGINTAGALLGAAFAAIFLRNRKKALRNHDTTTQA